MSPWSPGALGTALLVAAFLAAGFAAAAALVGWRRCQPALVTAATRVLHAASALLGAAGCLLLAAFAAGDLRLRAVAAATDETMSLGYRLAASWAGLDGSLLLWVVLLGAFGSAAVAVARRRLPELTPLVAATMAVTTIFFLAVVLFAKNPFAEHLLPVARGAGLNPLLRSPWMILHPPALYLGYVGMSVPFAFSVAALAAGRDDGAHLAAARPFLLGSWLALSVGLILGAVWAYEELGWGGYWAWDAVENAGLLPWLLATAALHSAVVAERRGGQRVTVHLVVILAFWLTILGTFLTRSGVVQSVHAFGRDDQLAMLFLLFLGVSLVVPLALLLHRAPALAPRRGVADLLSRDTAYLAGVWLLVGLAALILGATLLPTVVQHFRGRRVTVTPELFDRISAPLGLVLLLVTGAAPLLPWKTARLPRLLRAAALPLVAGVGTVAAVAALWPASRGTQAFVVRSLQLPVALTVLGVAAFTLVANVQEAARGLVRQGLLAVRRRVGGYLVHAGVALCFVAFAGRAFDTERHVTVAAPGETFRVGGAVLRFEGLVEGRDAEKDTVAAMVSVGRDRLAPARWVYVGGQSTSEVAVRRGLLLDLYLTLDAVDAGRVSLTVRENPLVSFLWLGFLVLLLGTAVALLPAAGPSQDRRSP